MCGLRGLLCLCFYKLNCNLLMKTQTKAENVREDTFVNFGLFKLRNIPEKNSVKGWIKKSKLIGVFAKNYSIPQRLNLYVKPSLKSKVNSIIPKWVNQLYIIEKCSSKWAYVKIKYKGQIKEGWLQPDKQCDNPYTTCN